MQDRFQARRAMGQAGIATLTESFLLVLVGSLFLLLSIPVPALAGISWTGDINPSAPDTWRQYEQASVGITSFGSVQVDSGSELQSHTAYLGKVSGSIGRIDVMGQDSAWNNEGALFVGDDGRGSLTVSDQGLVEAGIVYVAAGNSYAVGTIAVNGPGSHLAVDTHMSVGYRGNGTLGVFDGASIASRSVSLGSRTNSAGSVEVRGAGSLMEIGGFEPTDGQLAVGVDGTGKLVIADDAIVAVSHATHVDFRSNSQGEIQFEGGTLMTRDLVSAAKNLTGTGVVYTNNIISDYDILFDANRGLKQSFVLDEQPGQEITVHLDYDTTDTWTGRPSWFVTGYSDHGSATFTDGVQIEMLESRIGYLHGSDGIVTVDGPDTEWNLEGSIRVGYGGQGTLLISDGGSVKSRTSSIGYERSGEGAVEVRGRDSTWSVDVQVGLEGMGELLILEGGQVAGESSRLGYGPFSAGQVSVRGVGSSWSLSERLEVGMYGDASLSITQGGLVKTDGLSIDHDNDGDSFVYMASGGMLALVGEADESIDQYLGLVEGADAIRYWNDNLSDWASIVDATPGVDYTLEYFDDGELAGYTLLTVGVIPEPSTAVTILSMLFFGVVGRHAHA